MMRIITGFARGAKLNTLEGETTRPTSERLKEALFSMIQFEVEGRTVLDLFGGSGQLGLEALSRGAASATFIDSSRGAADLIISNAKNCRLFEKCRVSAMDSLVFLNGAAGRQSFDIIFLDPPYASGLTADCLRLILDGEILSAGGVVACETGGEAVGRRRKRSRETEEQTGERLLDVLFGGDFELMSSFTVRRSAVYGQSRLTLLELSNRLR